MQPFLRDAEFNCLSDRAVGIYLNVTVTEKHRFGGPELICLNSYFLSVSVQLHFIKKNFTIQVAFVQADLNLYLLPPRVCLGLEIWDPLLLNQNKHLLEQAPKSARGGAIQQNWITRAFSGSGRFRHVFSKGEGEKK